MTRRSADETPSPSGDGPAADGSPSTQRDRTPAIGGSLNGRPYRLGDDLRLLEASDTPWIHAFLDVRKKLDEDVPPGRDPDVLALRGAGRAGARLFVSLQWNFVGIFGEQDRTRMPPAESASARDLVEYATELLTAIEEPVERLALGNEPLWETLEADFRGPRAPLVPFTRELKTHVVEHYEVAEPRILVGALTRLYSEHLRRKYRGLYRPLLSMARNDDDVDGLDLHAHYRTLEEAEEMLYVARQQLPDGTLTVTEFSPVWRYDQHKDEPVASFAGGDAFAERYAVPRGTTVTEYLEAAKDDRLPPHEMAAFMAAMPWYNVSFVRDMHELLARYDVDVGTFGFLVEDDVRHVDWTDGWAPFPINCLFQPALIDSADGGHPHYLGDYRQLQRTPGEAASTP